MVFASDAVSKDHEKSTVWGYLTCVALKQLWTLCTIKDMHDYRTFDDVYFYTEKHAS
jgi:hypothetical protein